MNDDLEKDKATEYRAISARANYLQQDRPDIQYAVKEICRTMASPSVLDRRRLKRLGRYLVGRPRLVWRFPWQEQWHSVDGFSDSDWAGCKRTARSTSGGALCLGKHLVKSWASTQRNITLSSAEAELVAAVKASAEAIGLAQLLFDWGKDLSARIHVDSSAAIGVANRKGNGKMRHVKVGNLWIQELVEEGEIEVKKVWGSDNIADAFTKNLPQKILDKHLESMNLEFREGRAATGLHVQRDAI